jgi:hypothetical protein
MGARQEKRGSVREGRLGSWILLLLLTAASVDALSCGIRRAIRPIPVAPLASRALARARDALREAEAGRPEQLERAREAAGEALELEPDWVAAQRFLDDLAREELLGAEALRAHLRSLEQGPESAALLYLIGRLEGLEGTPRFERACRLDGSLAWAHHGVAWMSFQRGDLRRALRHGERALERARDAWERSSFAQALARYHLASARAKDAVQVLAPRLEDSELVGGDRVELAAWLARAELACERAELRERGYRRGLQLLSGAALTEAECVDLTHALLGAARTLAHDTASLEIELALGAREGAGRDRLRAELLLERGSRTLALELLQRDEDDGFAAQAPRRARALRLSEGEVRATLEEWLSELPPRALAEDGLPREARLRAVLDAARSGEDGASLMRLGQALIEAGWFREARGLALHLAGFELDAALELDRRAGAGLVLLSELRRLLDLVDAREPNPGSWTGSPADPTELLAVGGSQQERSVRLDDLDALLGAMQPLFDRYRGGRGRAQDLSASPRFEHGPFATLVHPGPRFSALDERSGLGRAGEAVAGLSAELEALGRFGLFGQAIGGGGPDGTLLRRLFLEQRSGSHLGTPFRGTVAWCEGTDLPSRPGRRGARITGAALHEGYWIDVEGVRADHRRWLRLQERFEAAAPSRRPWLEGRGPLLPEGAAGAEAGRERLCAGLGEGQRIRLAVLRERSQARAATGDRSAELVSLDELLEVTAIHEEGHLCDRELLLPLWKHPLRAFGIFVEAGMSIGGVLRHLEYRAQLVALCEVAEPRMPLAECADAFEGAGAGLTPHVAAYRELVKDLLAVLNRDLSAYPALDPRHYLLHQLHHLGAEDVRRVARQLARERGMLD